VTIAGKLAKFIYELKLSDVPENIVRDAKYHVLDTVGAIIAGSTGHLAGEYRAMGVPASGENSLLFPWGDNCEPLFAVCVNSAVAHCAEIDDIHPRSVVCTGGMTVPPALVFSMLSGQSGPEFLESVIAGYEVTTRIADSAGIKGETLLPKGWWPSAVFGTIGACASAGKALKLDETMLLNALGMAANMGGGLINGGAEGPSGRHMIFGWASMSGSTCAVAAKKGLSGFTLAFEDQRGFYASRSLEPDYESMFFGIGERFLFTDVSYKGYACAMQMQSAVHSFLCLMREYNLKPENILKIDVKLPSKALVVVRADTMPDNHALAAANCPYVISAAAFDGDILPNQFEEKKLFDPRLREFMKKVDVSSCKELDSYEGKWPGEVSIALEDGNTYKKRIVSPDGETLKDKQEFCDSKFKRTVSPVVGNAAMMRIREIILSLDSQAELNSLAREICQKEG